MQALRFQKQMDLLFKFVFCLTLVLFLMQTESAFGQDSFYIDNGSTLQKVENGDPTKIRVIEWQVRLYKTGQPRSGNGHWGMITGRTAASVMEKLKKAQNFELSYNNWAGRGRVPDPVNTHFNALGPIAKVEREQSAQEKERNKKRLIPKETLDRIEGAYKRARDYREAFDIIPEIIGDSEAKGNNPFHGVGDNLREYMDKLRDALEKLRILRDKLDATNAPAIDEINRSLDEINHALDEARDNAKKVSGSMGLKEGDLIPDDKQSSTANPPDTTIANEQKRREIEGQLEKLSKQLSSAFESYDPSNPEAVFQEINNVARQMLRLVETDPQSDADMKELARTLLSITETTDPQQLTQKLERLTELLERIIP